MAVMRGALAGFVATFPMTLTMAALRARLPGERARPMPPREVVDRAVQETETGGMVDETDREAVTSVAHFAFGTGAGALYGLLAGSRRASTLTGVAYGLAVWAIAYGVGLPSLGLHPAASRDTEDRNEVLIASHVVWGGVLGAIVGATANRQGRRSPREDPMFPV